jgi:hypothetical protein
MRTAMGYVFPVVAVTFFLAVSVSLATARDNGGKADGGKSSMQPADTGEVASTGENVSSGTGSEAITFYVYYDRNKEGEHCFTSPVPVTFTPGGRPQGEEGPSGELEAPAVIHPAEKQEQSPPSKPEEERQQPALYIKTDARDLNTGKALANVRFKVTPQAPPLPIPGTTERRDDKDFDKGPIEGHTGPDGTCELHVKGSSTTGFGGGTDASSAEIGVKLPPFESYTAKIKVDRSIENWDDPASYIGPVASQLVVRRWIVGDSMYVVLNVPKT